nr:MAG TPA: hypothetical protein [Caudoviricetes sp.]
MTATTGPATTSSSPATGGPADSVRPARSRRRRGGGCAVAG